MGAVLERWRADASFHQAATREKEYPFSPGAVQQLKTWKDDFHFPFGAGTIIATEDPQVTIREIVIEGENKIQCQELEDWKRYSREPTRRGFTIEFYHEEDGRCKFQAYRSTFD